MLQCMYTSLFASWLAATVYHLLIAVRYRGKRHQLGYELVIQSWPAHSVCKWKGRVYQMGLLPYYCLEVCPSNMQSRCITRRGRASGARHLENNVARASLQFSESATLHALQMNFSGDVIVKSSRSPFPRFLSSMWCSVNVFHDVSLLWPTIQDTASHPVIAWN